MQLNKGVLTGTPLFVRYTYFRIIVFLEVVPEVALTLYWEM